MRALSAVIYQHLIIIAVRFRICSVERIEAAGSGARGVADHHEAAAALQGQNRHLAVAVRARAQVQAVRAEAARAAVRHRDPGLAEAVA